MRVFFVLVLLILAASGCTGGTAPEAGSSLATEAPTTTPAAASSSTWASTTSTVVADPRFAFGVGGATVLEVEGGASGFVAGGSMASAPAFWNSDDGSAWERVPPGVDGAGRAALASDIVAWGSGYAAIGSIPATGMCDSVAFWISEDGDTWAQAPPPPACARDIAVVGGRLVVANGAACPDCRLSFWFTDDAKTWTEAEIAGARSDTGFVEVISAGGPGLVAVGGTDWDGSDSDGAIWTSVDGSTWTQAQTGARTLAGTVTSVAASDSAILAAGWEQGMGNLDPPPLLVSSTDGVLWQRLEGATGWTRAAAVNGLLATPEGFLAYGVDWQGAAIWASPDGAAWHYQELTDSAYGGWVQSADIVGEVIVAVGARDPDALEATTSPVATSWVLSLSEVDWRGLDDMDGDQGPAATDLAWRRIDVDAFGAGRLYEIATTATGLMAVGFRDNPDGSRNRVFLASEDGSTWDVVSVLPDQPAVFRIAGGGPGLVAVGFVESDNSWGTDAVFWHSADGVVWERVPHDDTLFGAAKPHGVVPFGSGLLAFGEGTVQTDDGTIVWMSADGREWTRSAQLVGVEPFELVVIGEQAVMAGFARGAVGVWTSADGIDWERVYSDQLPPATTHHGFAADADGNAIYVAAAQDRPGAVAWTSSGDLAVWSRSDIAIDDLATIRTLSADGRGGWIIAGRTPGEILGGWTSPDGLTWSAFTDSDMFGSGIGSVGIVDLLPFGGRIAGVGSLLVGGVERPAVWIGEQMPEAGS